MPRSGGLLSRGQGLCNPWFCRCRKAPAAYQGRYYEDGKTILGKLYANCASILGSHHGWPYVLSLVACGAAETPDLSSWIPDLRLRLQPKPFWYYGSTHFCAATTVEGVFTIVNEESSRDPETEGEISASRMPGLGPALTLSAAYVDEIVQIGESQAELLPTQVKYAKRHIIDLVTKLGTHYAKTSELSMDAIMRTFTGDVFERDRKTPFPKLRRAFLAWFSLLASNVSFTPSKSRPQDSFFRNTAKGRLAVVLHKTSDYERLRYRGYRGCSQRLRRCS
ncbi:hypothetical protein GGR57DRAFT_24482 [Xylariaceae sp. FL1272]|nr:hypothetical protein GGR57DRAFT_24482 [Xylariaceae sp. FL1272]